MTHHPFSVANFFIDIAGPGKKGISPLKLQKLVYFSHGWHLAIFDEPLIDEPIEAWRYGPVIDSLYHEFKRFGNNPITSPATLPIDDEFRIVPPPADEMTRKLLNKVWEAYGKIHAHQLANITHRSDTPWSKTWRPDSQENAVIDNKIIKAHYQALLENK